MLCIEKVAEKVTVNREMVAEKHGCVTEKSQKPYEKVDRKVTRKSR